MDNPFETNNVEAAPAAPAAPTAPPVAETPVAETPAVDNSAEIAALEQKIAELEAGKAARSQAVTDARVHAKEAKKYAVAMKQQLTNATDETRAEAQTAYDAAVTGETGWNAAVDAAVAEREAGKADAKLARAQIRDLKSAQKPKRTRVSTGTRQTFVLHADTTLAPVAGAEVASGMMKMVTDACVNTPAFATVVSYLVSAIQGGAAVPTSAQWVNTPDVYVIGYIRGALRAGYIAIVDAGTAPAPAAATPVSEAA